MKILVVAFLSLFIFNACNSAEDINSLMILSESKMNEHPDSAFAILDWIDRAALESGEQKAKFSLLYAMAMHKNYIDSDSDSLTSVALDYYKINGTDREKAYAFFYHSLTKSYANNLNETIDFVSQASVFAELTDDYYIRGQINHLLGYCYFEQFDYKTALVYMQKACSDYEKTGNLMNILRATYDIGEMYFYLEQFDEATVYYTKAKDLAKDLNYEEKYIHALVQLEIIMGDNTSDYSAHKELSDFYLGKQKVKNYYSIFTSYYVRKNQLDSAKYYYELYFKNIDKITSYNVHRLAGRRGVYEKLGEFETALYYEKLHSYYRDSLYKVNLANVAKDAEQKYHTKYIQDTYHMLQFRHRIVLIVYMLSIIIVSILIWSGIRWRRRLIREREMKIAEYNAYVAEARAQHTQLKNHCKMLEQESLDSNEKVGVLFELLERRIQSIYRLSEYAYKYEYTPESFYQAFKKELKISNKSKTTFITDMLSITDVCRNGIIMFLREHYPNLTDYELCYCALVSFGFSQESIRVLMGHTNIYSIYSLRSKIRKKMSIPAGDSVLEKHIRELVGRLVNNEMM